MAGVLAGCTREPADPATAEEAAAEEDSAGRGLSTIGVQLYTVRSLMEEDFEGTIRRVAGLGYTELEFAGYYDRSPDEVRALLDELGVQAPSTHVLKSAMQEDLVGVIETAQQAGHQYVTCPFLQPEERSLADYRNHAALFNEWGAACQEAGLRFAYHNHEFEFEPTEGVVPYDLLLAETDPELVYMQLDLYWIVVAGQSAEAYFNANPGRFPMVHVKDRGPDGGMVPVGTGDIDFASIFAMQEAAGTTHFFVEHDHPDDPMASITTGLSASREPEVLS